MDQKIYISPEMTVIQFESTDIILSSNDTPIIPEGMADE